MEERWLSRKRRRRAPDIRDFINVHGKVVKPHLAAGQSEIPSVPKLPTWQTTITSCQKPCRQSTAFAYTTGVRKRAPGSQSQENIHNVVPGSTTQNERDEDSIHSAAENTMNNTKTVIREECVESCRWRSVDALSSPSPSEDQDYRELHTSPKTVDLVGSIYDTAAALWSEEFSTIGSQDPTLIDTEALLKDLSEL